MGDATDAAKARADERGIDIDEVEGTGKDGRVTASDVDAWEDDGGSSPADPNESVEVEVEEVEAATVEDQEQDAEAALEGAGIDPEDLYAKEAALPENASPSGGTLPTVPEQVGPPLTETQLEQLERDRASIEAIAERTGWEGQKQEPEEDVAPEDADNPEPDEEVEPPPQEALAARRQESDFEPLPGSAAQRQRDGASEESHRNPLLQRPAEDQTGHATAQHSIFQKGDTLPGERSLDNDSPAYQTAENHVPGTPLPDEYYETAGPAPQPTLHPKRTQEELDAINGDKEDDD